MTEPRTRRRGRSKGDIKEEAILDTADCLLREKAFRDVGIDELARGAGVTRPTFYFYFSSKNEMLSTLVRRVTERRRLAPGVWQERDEDEPGVTIRRSIAASAEAWSHYGHILCAAVQTWRSNPEIRGFWEDTISEFVRGAADLIRRERQAGRAIEGQESPEALATALVWMLERCMYTNALDTEPSLSDGELVETLTAIWIRSVYGGTGS